MKKRNSIKEIVLENMDGIEFEYLSKREIVLIIGGVGIGIESTLKSLTGKYDSDLVEKIMNELELKYTGSLEE